LTTQHYWRAGGKISDVSRRGYQLLQTIPEDQEGDPPDTDLTQNDALGGAAIWLAPV
jgi:hypothetical protein